MARPRIYEDPEVLDNAVDAFFLKCIEDKVRPTVTGLALFLGFADKSTLYEYRDREEFSYSIKKGLTLIEHSLEIKLEGANVSGVIFALKNMGWTDRTEQTIVGAVPITWNETRYQTKDGSNT